MKIEENVPLAKYTTFKIGGPARFFCSVKSDDDLVQAINFAKDKSLQIFVLGGGSNVLIRDSGFSGLVIHIEMSGVTFDRETMIAAAGENWDELVHDTVERGFYGIENLSAIPGSVGAAPVQNIGAYGAEIADVLESVRALDTHDMQFKELTKNSCQFSYRTSLFKREKGRYIITSVRLKLNKNGKPNISYKEVGEYLEKNNIQNPSLKEMRKAVIDIRWNKLPDWKLWGTAGSFFKNPIISADHFDKLKTKYPGIPGFAEDNGMIKVSLGWILDRICDVKGMCVGNVCTYEKQALVLVAKPGATSEEVVSLAHKLMNMVKEKTDIEIEGEVEWVN